MTDISVTTEMIGLAERAEGTGNAEMNARCDNADVADISEMGRPGWGDKDA